MSERLRDRPSGSLERFAAVGAAGVAAVVALGACTRGPARVELHSREAATAAERVKRLCALVRCPSRPEDAAFHLRYEDPTRDLSLGPQRLSLAAVLRVPASELPRWSRDCRPARLEPRPSWATPFLEERGWRTTEAPEMLRCDREERHLHVRDGLVLRRIVPPDS